MDEKAMKREGHGGTTTILIAVWALLPILYVLSTGPAVLLRDRGFFEQDSFLRFYWPVGWAIQTLPYFDVALSWYLQLWSF